MGLKTQTVELYRWVKASERLPNNGLVHFRCDNLHDVVFYNSKHGFYKPKVIRTGEPPKRKNELEINPLKYPLDKIEWLEAITPSELKGRDEKLIGEAFDAGYKHGWGQSEFEGESVTPTKSQYIQSIIK